MLGFDSMIHSMVTDFASLLPCFIGSSARFHRFTASPTSLIGVDTSVL